MSSYLSNLLTTTTSRYNSLRRTLLSSEDDGDTEDDTHVCRVLRAYYTEKGRQFPQWLPPDPNDRRATTPQPYAQQASGYFTGANTKGPYGSVQQQNPAGQRGSLSDLWDAPAAGKQAAPAQPTSLRNARRPMNQPPPQQPTSASLAPSARPLPSQRAGSYQSVASQRSAADPSPTPSSMGGGTAQDRLKARLWGGGRSGSPMSATNSTTSSTSSQAGAAYPYDQSGNQRYGR